MEVQSIYFQRPNPKVLQKIMPRARDVHTEYVHQALQRLNFFTEPIRENLFFPGLTSCSPDSVLIT